ncbi:CDP-alcohol phosphatidyltransferase family protein [Microvirga sp. W0021]|uniref:CDP-diacylglycerol--glycerol-3-phosphate 3-phosphatidyltransferase n=1 Tax=Hohaiivirga grylli TaxID=3133970 RepID=A0ABV0BKY4_9HYPH
MTIPNLITIARLVIVPVVIVMILSENWGFAFALFVIAGISDGLDGFIARRFNMQSEFGAYIDPLADKALMVSIFVTLAAIKLLPAWFVIIVVFRDILIVSAVILSWVMDKPIEIKPLIISKLNTAAQISYAAALLGANAFGIDISAVNFALMLTVTALTIASASAYFMGWMRHMDG